MQAVVKKIVYSFRYGPGPGYVWREGFHIVLKACETLWSARDSFSGALGGARETH